MTYDPLYDLDKGYRENIYNVFLYKGTLIKIRLKHVLSLKNDKEKRVIYRERVHINILFFFMN